jgi:hypothetical protein
MKPGSGFKRPTLERVRTVHTPVPEHLRRGSMAMVDSQPAEGQPKRVYVRSKALLEACRLIPCQHSGVSDGTVCAAHSNALSHGKARGVKADDNRVAALSYAVHSMIDQGSRLTKSEREELWWQAHVKTVRELLKRGLWPQDCPIPDMRRMN